MLIEYKYISLTIYQFIAYTNKYSCHSVPQISSSVLSRLWGFQDKNTNTMMIPTLYTMGNGVPG